MIGNSFLILYKKHTVFIMSVFLDRKCFQLVPSCHGCGFDSLFCQKLTRLGQFKIKDEPPSISTSLHPGSLFSGRDSSTTMGTSLKGKSMCMS